MNLTDILKNKKNLVNLITGIVFSLSSANYGFAQNRSIDFKKESFENIKETAKKTNKLIFVDGYAIW
ncbi:MAG: hypothetical protein AABX80_01240, partial [Nanoarchaeota archaeon]